jgi:hypothetical protein
VTASAPGGSGTTGGGAGANGLGWVLHAIGDAMCPHHTIGALGWGHALFERYSGFAWQGDPNEAAFQEENLETHYPDLVKALGYAFQWWKFLDDGQKQTGQLPIEGFIEALAKDTFKDPFSTVGRAFKDGVSLDYAVGSSDISKVLDAYGTEQAALRDRMLRTIGATAAFLVKAADFVPDLSGVSSPCSCETGKARSGMDFSGRPMINPTGECISCGTGAFAALPDWLDGKCVAVCPPEKPKADDLGRCVAADVCPPDAPFKKNGVCVAGCCPVDPTCPAGAPVRENGICSVCSTPLVANYRECVGACPFGQVVDESSHSICGPPAPASSPKTCGGGGASNVLSSDTCVARAGFCATNADCCSGDCQPLDHVCRGSAGETCQVDNDCATRRCIESDGIKSCALGTPTNDCALSTDCGSAICTGLCSDNTSQQCTKDSDCASCECTGRKCQASQVGGTCFKNLDCASGDCLQGICAGAPGDACSVPTDCVSGSCSGFCSDNTLQACTKDSNCTSGQCTGRKCHASPGGGTCATDLDCASRDCFQGICAGAPGDPCQVSTDCAPGPGPQICTASKVCCLPDGTQYCTNSLDCCSGRCVTPQGGYISQCATTVIIP